MAEMPKPDQLTHARRAWIEDVLDQGWLGAGAKLDEAFLAFQSSLEAGDYEGMIESLHVYEGLAERLFTNSGHLCDAIHMPIDEEAG
jgi:hypothetical protein